MKFAKGVVKLRIPILILSLVLLVPSVFGIVKTRINYDMLDYLPDSLETIQGQDVLMNDFGKGAFSLIILEDMKPKDVSILRQKIETVDHVDTVIWYDSIADITIPMEMLPDSLYEAFNKDNATMMAVFFDSSTSADVTMDAIREIRSICGKQCFVSGMSAMVTDLKDLCEREEPVYVGIAVVMALLIMILLMDNWIIPLIFMASIGIMILINLGSNVVLGEISYITKALSAVLQLAVTMDYSIFLWHSYEEQKRSIESHKDAMAVAIQKTLASVVGSSVTTVAGFIALCFMSFTLGKDLGIVMAKGVVLGVIGCVTVLPALILCFDRLLEKTAHKALIPGMDRVSTGILKIFPILLVIFLFLIPPAFYGYQKTNNEVYYKISDSLPKDLEYAIANSKLEEQFGVGATHMLLVDAGTPEEQVRFLIQDMEKVEGVNFVLGMESIVGSGIPEELLPESVTEVLKSDNWELILIGSAYDVASDEVNVQVDRLNEIVKKYDPKGLLIGEAPCTKDMIEVTDRDFRVVNIVSILAIFVIIAFVTRSISLPFILISVIELAIFINLGLPHFMGERLPFIAPICISTIQLGATVDYAILMTTRYKTERVAGQNRKSAVRIALATSIPSILVSGLGLFAATFGVAVYSDIDMISSMCSLLARGAIISMFCVILFLPSLLALCDKLICKTTLGMGKCSDKPEVLPTGENA